VADYECRCHPGYAGTKNVLEIEFASYFVSFQEEIVPCVLTTVLVQCALTEHLVGIEMKIFNAFVSLTQQVFFFNAHASPRCSLFRKSFGFVGRFCEVKLDACFGVLCQNNGSKANVGGVCRCQCPQGFHGHHCEQGKHGSPHCN
jgi:hypothetical protein